MNNTQKQIIEYMNDWLTQEDDVYLLEAWNQVKYAVLDSVSDYEVKEGE